MLLGVGALALLTVAWIVVTGVLARQQVNKLEDRLQVVKQLVARGDIDGARQAAQGIPTLARRAHLLTTGPAWWAAAQVPYLGDPFDVMRGATTAGKSVGTSGVATLLDIAKTLDPRTLRSSGDTLKLAPLKQTAPELRKAADDLDDAINRVDNLPGDTWFNPINHARLSLSVQLHSIVGYVDAAANATDILPTMLGDGTPQRYFIGLQNEAEMRGTGGLPGAFAIAETSHGKIKFIHFGSDAELLPAATHQRIETGLDFGAGYDRLYGDSAPTNFIVNSNASPHFPYAAQIWATMWERISGQKINGSIAVDPTTLAYFLSVTGPVTLPNGQAVNADNIVSLTEKDEYVLYPNNEERKNFLVDVLQAASKKLTSGSGSATQLAQTMTEVSNQNRLQVWSADPRIEKVLASTSYGGAFPTDDRPFGAFIINNGLAGKLDYYLTRTMDYQRTGCGSTRDVFVTMTLTNNAPAAGLPAYVTGNLKLLGKDGKPGDNRAVFDYYATGGAQLLSASINDEPSTMSVVQSELGKRVFRTDLQLPRGKTVKLTLHLQEPAGTGEPQIWKQPGVTNLALHTFSQRC